MIQHKTAVIALGGNAISPKGEIDTIANQFRNTRKSCTAIMNFIKQDYHLAITHGNGPQVGNALLRVEIAIDKTPFLPLGICDADTEGGMGYMIEQSLQNALITAKVDRDVVTIITQIIVDADDPSINNPTKYIGRYYEEKEIKKLARKFNWQVKEIPGKGWRRVVPSPLPKTIINRKAIKHLVDVGTIVIAAGGGGIPVYVMENGLYEGFDAVIDKDLASATLASDISAQELIILTDVDQIALNFGKPDQENIDIIHADELKSFYDQGQFPAGSMGPKVCAALDFIEHGGESVTITSLERAQQGIQTRKVTRIID
jgi:carbamate kinase